ncbi:MAG TPA: porphobilinogen synthase [Blastocatellia bacterium]|nr:porphobilinogen synthase [Blastocatellia bacterium]
MSDFVHRPRRLRQSAVLRTLVRETQLSPSNFIYPLFACSGEGVKREIRSMPGVYNLSVDEIVKEAEAAQRWGVSSVIVFGLPEAKDEIGSGAYAEDGIVQRAIRALKREVKDMLVIADTCLCEYTSHGHCGVIKNNDVDNDPTLELIAQTAVSQAEAGADVIAPSGMMDGMIAAIRRALDESGFQNIPVLSYAIKYASAYYGPFREAADSTPQFGDRRSYQMDPANIREALREADLDVEQGADMLMVKPALPYLDVIRAARERYKLPIAAYQVSGEYAQIKAAAQLGWIDGDRVMMESLTAIKRAGADMILTYFAKDAIRFL